MHSGMMKDRSTVFKSIHVSGPETSILKTEEGARESLVEVSSPKEEGGYVTKMAGNLMNHIVCFVIISVLLLSLERPARSQIVITMDEIPSAIGMQTEYRVEVGDSIPVDLGSEGGPQMWDFRQASFVEAADTVTERIVSLTGTSLGPVFPEANLVRETGAIGIVGIDTASGYQFMRLDEDGLDVLGFGFIDTAGVPQGIPFDSPFTSLVLPLENGASWTETATSIWDLRVKNPSPSIFLPDESLDVSVKIDVESENRVDGWGNVMLTTGEFESLRLRQYNETHVNASVRTGFGWMTVFDTTLSVFMYDYYTEYFGSVMTVTSRAGEIDSLFSFATSVRRMMWTNVLSGLPGDVNTDGIIDMIDVMIAIDHILGIQTLEEEAFERADCNGDGFLSLIDLVGIVRVILGIGECEPTRKTPVLGRTPHPLCGAVNYQLPFQTREEVKKWIKANLLTIEWRMR